MKKLLSVLAFGCAVCVPHLQAAPLGEGELQLAQQEAELALQEAELAKQGAEFAQQEAEVEARMAEARRQLDEAARRLAEVSREAYRKEYEEHRTKPVLGVLLNGPGDSKGLKLLGVTPDGGACDAGLQAGDWLTAINGVRLDGDGEKPLKRLGKVLAEGTPGDTMTVEYVRDDTEFVADVVTQGRGEHVAKMFGDLDDVEIELEGLGEHLGEQLSGLSRAMELGQFSELAKLGEGFRFEFDPDHVLAMGDSQPRLVDVDEDLGGYFGIDSGVLVVSSTEESELKAGDILLELAGDRVNTVKEAYLALGKADGEVEAKVLRKKRERTIELAAAEFPRVHQFEMGQSPGKSVIRIERRGQDDVDVRVIVDDGHDRDKND